MGIRVQLLPWREVSSEIPQGSVLGPELCELPSNDLQMSSKMTKFLDDTKLCRVVKSLGE